MSDDTTQTKPKGTTRRKPVNITYSTEEREKADERYAAYQAGGGKRPFATWVRMVSMGEIETELVERNRLELKESALKAITRQKDRAVDEVQLWRQFASELGLQGSPKALIKQVSAGALRLPAAPR